MHSVSTGLASLGGHGSRWVACWPCNIVLRGLFAPWVPAVSLIIRVAAVAVLMPQVRRVNTLPFLPHALAG